MITVRGRVTFAALPREFPRRVRTSMPESARGGLLTGDFNGDGRDDVVVESRDHSTITVALGQADGSLSFQHPVLTSGGILSAAGDVDGDGCADAVFWRDGTHTLVVGRSDCAGGFSFERERSIDLRTPSNFAVKNISGHGASTIIVRDPRQETFLSVDATSGTVAKLEQFAPANALSALRDTYGGLFGDFDGDGRTDLLVPSSLDPMHGGAWHTVFANGSIRATVQFPESAGVGWSAVIGDFNGDSRADLLAASVRGEGWWIAYSEGLYAVEVPVASPTVGLEHQDVVSSGDIDGDGTDELLIRSGSNSELWTVFAAPSPGVGGVRIVADRGAASATTDADGNFELTVSVSPSTDLVPEMPGVHFFPERIRIARSGSKRVARFNAEPDAEDTVGSTAGRLHYTGPYVCIGYQPTVEAYHSAADAFVGVRSSKWGFQKGLCPAGYALLNVQNGAAPKRHSGGSTCCRLPYDDILTDEHKFVDDSCPDGWVATGTADTGQRTRQMRCTRINGERFELGPPEPGVYWGFALGMRSERDRVPKEQLPLALRYGAGRINYEKWDTHGCVGRPWGGLLVAATGPRCADYQFRQLRLRASAAGLPAGAGTPVAMFPACRSIANAYDPTTGCIRSIAPSSANNVVRAAGMVLENPKIR